MANGKLSALKIKSLTAPGRYGDGDGLWLQVRDARHRSWLFRYAVRGRARQMGLGSLNTVSLADARQAAQAARKQLHEGIDPLDERQRDAAEAVAKAPQITFACVSDRYLAAHESAWRNAKHRYQWRATLDLAHAVFGDRPVGSILTSDVMLVLDPIWQQKPETASRLRGRIEAVLDYATARGWRSGENPARWRGHLDKLLPRTSRIARVQHHSALPWSRIGSFMKDLRSETGVAARALEFTILTAARTGEVIGAKWEEMDLKASLWIVPAGRMKAGKEHRVPLSAPTLAILRQLQSKRCSGFVFPGSKFEKPLSNMAMMMLLRRMKHGDLTVHGFRSTFRDWCAEATTHPHEVAEMALAHTVRDKVEAAYRRGDLMEKRRQLMADWASLCGSELPCCEDWPVDAGTRAA